MMPLSNRNQARLEQLEASFEPIKVLEIELGERIKDVSSTRNENGAAYRRARALVRLHHQPLGMVEFTLGEKGLPASEVAKQIWQTLGTQINRHLRLDGLSPIDRLDGRVLPTRSHPLCHSEVTSLLAALPMVSVVICTRDRTDSLKTCLDSFRAMSYPHFEIILVDNAPGTNATAELVQNYFFEMPELIYVREDRPGLSNARNAGLRAARGEIIAFTDDDVVVDRFWLEQLVQAFNRAENVGCVTGLVFPAEIETFAQYLMEQYGGMGKGYQRQIFDLKEHRSPNPLVPFSAGWFGVGANMAFKTSVLRQLGGFDPAAGTGTPARGGEDLAIFFQVVTRGYRLVYEPAALLYHFHRRSYDGFRKQIYGYGVGLTAYLTKVLLDRPALLLDIARRTPAGVHYLLNSQSSKNNTKLSDYPRELDSLERLGMLAGPWSYLRSRWQAGRSRKQRLYGRAPGNFNQVNKVPER
jgi:O-antigen biosynthesis protein